MSTQGQVLPNPVRQECCGEAALQDSRGKPQKGEDLGLKGPWMILREDGGCIARGKGLSKAPKLEGSSVLGQREEQGWEGPEKKGGTWQVEQ